MAGLSFHGRLALDCPVQLSVAVYVTLPRHGGAAVPRASRPRLGQDATWGMAFFAVKGTARARRARGSPSISPAERGAAQDAGDTCASLRALRTLRFHPQPPVTEALPIERDGCCVA